MTRANIRITFQGKLYYGVMDSSAFPESIQSMVLLAEACKTLDELKESDLWKSLTSETVSVHKIKEGRAWASYNYFLDLDKRSYNYGTCTTDPVSFKISTRDRMPLFSM